VFIIIKKCVLNGTTVQFRASVSWSSGFETCEVLLVDAVSHSPYPQRGGPGLCIDDFRRQSSVCLNHLPARYFLKGPNRWKSLAANIVRMGHNFPAVDSSWNVIKYGNARKGKRRGNWRMEWVASTLHSTSEHGVSSVTTADAHTSAASSRLTPPSI